MSDHNWGKRPIKNFSTTQIETALATALAELTGQEYEVTITKHDLEPELNAWMSDTSEINLRIKKKTKMPDFSKDIPSI